MDEADVVRRLIVLVLGGLLAVAGTVVTLSSGSGSGGGSEASVKVSGVLEADLRNGGRLKYSGDPVLGRADVDSGSTLAPAATTES